MNMIKIGLIGCGWFGNVHLDNLLKIDGVGMSKMFVGEIFNPVIW